LIFQPGKRRFHNDFVSAFEKGEARRVGLTAKKHRSGGVKWIGIPGLEFKGNGRLADPGLNPGFVDSIHGLRQGVEGAQGMADRHAARMAVMDARV
jgi:hypothetical protein